MNRDVIWTRSEARDFDRRMIEEFGIPSVVLMENAGRGAAEWILQRREELKLNPRDLVGVLCGGGNNGGDGYVLARHLALAGQEVHIYELSDPESLSPDAATFRHVCLKLGLSMALWDGDASVPRSEEVSCWVDGVLGSGFKAPLRGHLAGLFGMIESARQENSAVVIALDCPSGLDLETGIPADGALRADATLTFGALKAGFQGPDASSLVGEVIVIGLGAPLGEWSDG